MRPKYINLKTVLGCYPTMAVIVFVSNSGYISVHRIPLHHYKSLNKINGVWFYVGCCIIQFI